MTEWSDEELINNIDNMIKYVKNEFEFLVQDYGYEIESEKRIVYTHVLKYRNKTNIGIDVNIETFINEFVDVEIIFLDDSDFRINHLVNFALEKGVVNETELKIIGDEYDQLKKLNKKNKVSTAVVFKKSVENVVNLLKEGMDAIVKEAKPLDQVRLSGARKDDNYRSCIQREDIERCSKIVEEELKRREIKVDEDIIKIITEDIMNISYSKGGDYSYDVLKSYTKVYFERGFYKRFI